MFFCFAQFYALFHCVFESFSTAPSHPTFGIGGKMKFMALRTALNSCGMPVLATTL